jgi:hypothetical protein
MNASRIKYYAALSASWMSTGVFIYIGYSISQPYPIMHIDYIDDSNEKAIVNVTSSYQSQLRDAKVTHQNLRCLRDKGYIIKELCRKPYEPVVYIENAANRFSLSNDCAACRVNTEIDYKTLFGRRKEILEWSQASNHELIKVKPHRT